MTDLVVAPVPRVDIITIAEQGPPGPQGPSGAGSAFDADTTAMSSGLFGYFSGAGVVSPTDSASILPATSVGCFTGTAGKMSSSGLVMNIQCTTAGGTPSVGAKMFLAAASDDGATGAGKLTATPPTSGVLAPVATCADPSSYAGSKTCAVLVDLLPTTQL